jgi:murein L,D-transpeptidase YcbB/YkuD
MMHTTVYSRIWILAIAIFVWLYAHGMAVSQQVVPPPLATSMSEQLRGRLETVGHTAGMTIQSESIRALDSLLRFYERRSFRPVWLCEEGPLPHTEAFVQVISQAEREGLRAASYHRASIEQLMAEQRLAHSQPWSQQLRSQVDLELLLTDAFFMYGSQMLSGQTDPRTLHEVWFANGSEIDLETRLQQAVEANHVVELLQSLRPTHVGYLELQKALVSYRDIAARGGWPVIPNGPTLQRGDRGPRVMALRTRLRLTADLDRASAPVDDVFDTALEQGLQRFQERHGLNADGVVGTSTLTALNVPAEARVRQIELNMERWRWLPHELGDRYILVNVANFALDVIEHGQSVLAMRVIIGKPERRTPFFSADMTYLVLSPHWYVPPTIAIQDKLPLIRRDPSYVARQNFKLFRDGESGATRVDPLSIDWSAVSARNFPYRLRQDPGPRNALGRVKFMFPNSYHVYLHDTPSRELFAKTERAFSSGCIRLEKPIELAEYLLRNDPRWSRQKILATIARGAEQVVHLPTTVPVHLLYWTAWVDAQGRINFRKDIYERDKVLDTALRESFPAPKGADQPAIAQRG